MNTSIKSISETENRCYVMDLRKEYGPDKVGKEDFAIITDLTESELNELYGEEIQQYKPYLIMTLEMGEVIFESHRNEWKHLKRQSKYGVDYSTTDCDFAEHHPEFTYIPNVIKDMYIEQRKDLLYKAIDNLTDIQKNRIFKHFFRNMSIAEIAKEENVKERSVYSSIDAAKERLKKALFDLDFDMDNEEDVEND